MGKLCLKEQDSVSSRPRWLSSVLLCVIWPGLTTAVLMFPCYIGRAQTPQRSVQGNPQLLTSHPPSGEALGPVDWIFVIDTSASMSGLERGAKNIFPRVQKTLSEFIPEIRDGDSLAIFVFDLKSRPVLKMQIRGDSDRNAVGPLINNLSARGPRTQTGAGLADALNEVYSRQDRIRPAAIILLTDGKEDVRGIKNPIRIPDAINLIRDQDVPYVFYVSLGTEIEPKLSDLLKRINEKAAGHGRAFYDPGAVQLPDEASKIREFVQNAAPPPPPPPPPFKLDITPDGLRLPNIVPGEQGGPYTIDLQSSQSAKLAIALLNVPPDHFVEGIPDTLDVGPEKIRRVQFTVRLGKGATERLENYKIRVTAPPELDPKPHDIPITIAVGHSTVESILIRLSRWSFWLMLIVLILLLAWYFWREYYYYDRYPWEVIESLIRPRSRAGVLHTREGDIALDRPVITIGRGGSTLRNSAATVEIYLQGTRHWLKVREGTAKVLDAAGKSELSLEAGGEFTLRHRDRIMLQDDGQASVYLRSARKR